MFHLSSGLGHGGLLVMTYAFALCMALAIAHGAHRRQLGASPRQSRIAVAVFGTGMAAMIILMWFSTVSDTRDKAAQLKDQARQRQEIADNQRDNALSRSQAHIGGMFQTKFMEPSTPSGQPAPQ